MRRRGLDAAAALVRNRHDVIDVWELRQCRPQPLRDPKYGVRRAVDAGDERDHVPRPHPVIGASEAGEGARLGLGNVAHGLDLGAELVLQLERPEQRSIDFACAAMAEDALK